MPEFSSGLSLPLCNLYFGAQNPLVWIFGSALSLKRFPALLFLHISQFHAVKSDDIS